MYSDWNPRKRGSQYTLSQGTGLSKFTDRLLVDNELEEDMMCQVIQDYQISSAHRFQANLDGSTK